MTVNTTLVYIIPLPPMTRIVLTMLYTLHQLGYVHCTVFIMIIRDRPWRYSVIPSTPDFPTEYQIRRNSNPAGLPVFAAILVPGFRPSTIILTHMFKQIKLIRITLMSMFKVHPGSPNEVPVRLQLIYTRRRGKRSDTGDCGIVYSARGFSWLLPRIV